MGERATAACAAGETLSFVPFATTVSGSADVGVIVDTATGDIVDGDGGEGCMRWTSHGDFMRSTDNDARQRLALPSSATRSVGRRPSDSTDRTNRRTQRLERRQWDEGVETACH